MTLPPGLLDAGRCETGYQRNLLPSLTFVAHPEYAGQTQSVSRLLQKTYRVKHEAHTMDESSGSR